MGLHFSEGRAFLRLAEEAQPEWLLLAVLCQAGTYVAQAEVWRVVGRAAGFRLKLLPACEISLAKLFADQALPSAGISSSVLAAAALEQRQMPHGAVRASVALNMISYSAAYVMALLIALGVAVHEGLANALIVSLTLVFIALSAGLAIVFFVMSGEKNLALIPRIERVRLIRSAIEFIGDADPRLTRSPSLLLQTTVFQLTIVMFDVATMMALTRSLGVAVPFGGVFVSFMVSSLFRTMGFMPGGLGTFETSQVLMLKTVGIALPVALSATFLFRGLSFWFPMLPGWWCSRRLTTQEGSVTTSERRAVTDYWSVSPETVAQQLESALAGLSSAEAARRLREVGSGELRPGQSLSRSAVLLRQVRSPLLLLLVFAAAVSAGTGEWSDAVIVLVIVLATVGIGYWREYGAQRAVADLMTRVRTLATVIRDGQSIMVPREQVVSGDIVLLSSGSLVPADARVFEAVDLFVSESALTGESFPVEKRPGTVAAGASLSERTNCVFLGTNVRSGTGRCLVVAVGRATEFGGIAKRLARRAPETDFDRGIRWFGYLLTSAMLIIVLLVFAANMLAGRPPVETLLFSVALAVGLSPELLPAILSVNLSRGAQMMARRGVLVRRLNAIENLGSMNVLCTDKTGTLTEGVVRLEGAYDALGAPSADVLERAAMNAALETGLSNPLDEAILQARMPDLATIRKLAEIPFDFIRKRVSVVAQDSDGGATLIIKGAVQPVLDVCTRTADGRPFDAAHVAQTNECVRAWSEAGIRVLAVATRPIDVKDRYSRSDETDLSLLGFLTFLDSPKEGVATAIADLNRLGVAIKLISGDNRLVAQHVARLVGMAADRVLTGTELARLEEVPLWQAVDRTDVFAEVDPVQKERIIVALRRGGYVVGFLGDGVNDAPAMHAADTSLSVEQAVDVAREAADFVLLERDLDVIRGGIEEGRRTFANTLKYILTTTSANLGNMISMAVASLFLPFLPLTAGQILLNNLLSDVPALGIADDSVDPELVERPPRWDMRFIGRFMIEFGMLSSVFDFLTFGLLLVVAHATVPMFRTGWFVESLLTELVVALVVRTRRACFRSRPGDLLLGSTAIMIVVAFLVPYLPYAEWFGFVPLPARLLLALAAVTVAYVGAAELGKREFYRRRARLTPVIAR